jgi:hypothetical protein
MAESCRRSDHRRGGSEWRQRLIEMNAVGRAELDRTYRWNSQRRRR